MPLVEDDLIQPDLVGSKLLGSFWEGKFVSVTKAIDITKYCPSQIGTPNRVLILYGIVAGDRFITQIRIGVAPDQFLVGADVYQFDPDEILPTPLFSECAGVLGMRTRNLLSTVTLNRPMGTRIRSQDILLKPTLQVQRDDMVGKRFGYIHNGYQLYITQAFDITSFCSPKKLAGKRVFLLYAHANGEYFVQLRIGVDPEQVTDNFFFVIREFEIANRARIEKVRELVGLSITIFRTLVKALHPTSIVALYPDR